MSAATPGYRDPSSPQKTFPHEHPRLNSGQGLLEQHLLHREGNGLEVGVLAVAHQDNGRAAIGEQAHQGTRGLLGAAVGDQTLFVRFPSQTKNKNNQPHHAPKT